MLELLWINFLHIYQPPTLEKDLLVRIAKEAYLNIVKILKKNPRHKITLNVTGCLTEYLYQIGFTKLIDDIAWLAKRGQVELTGTAAFHPLLPLIPLKEAKKQIEINNDINSKHFGSVYKPSGFYLPEMAYSEEVGRLVKQMGFKWIILDEIAFSSVNDGYGIDYSRKYKIKGVGLNVIFRDRNASRTFVPDEIRKKLNGGSRPEAIVTATDGELYGHKYVDEKDIFSSVLKNKNLKTATVSEWLQSISREDEVEVWASSWESTVAEIEKDIPYSLWRHPKNKIHDRLWRLAEFALALNYREKRDLNHFASRLHLERGLASCTFWWASGKDFKMLGDPAWSPEEVEKGALELLRSIRSLIGISAGDKIRAEKMFLEIHRLMWSKHWKKITPRLLKIK